MGFRRDVRDKSCHRGSLAAEPEARERCSHNRSRTERERERERERKRPVACNTVIRTISFIHVQKILQLNGP
jgi:hypothetical protein